MRFAREIVEQARAAVGPKFPLIMRISGDEYIEGGRTIEETVEVCKVMEKAGIDAFDISGGITGTSLFSISPYKLSKRQFRFRLSVPEESEIRSMQRNFFKMDLLT